ncbi:unnamed protein product [Staurois parvus]|uniref:Uncharacterized protein n=1 Tax=Staurois parvus TaxID=386267 RepID=A0ABN9BC09_9NEOB|nr:unnamed protein product [Staurois parvus]
MILHFWVGVHVGQSLSCQSPDPGREEIYISKPYKAVCLHSKAQHTVKTAYSSPFDCPTS